jgi:sigma-B regulation protein RsbU (phosphoserine phosphatase)
MNPDRVKLRNKQIQLNSLLEITKAISQNFSRGQIFSLYEYVLRQQLMVNKLALFIHDQEWKCAVFYGSKPLSDDFDVMQHLIHINEMRAPNDSDPASLKEFELIIPVTHKNKPLAFVMMSMPQGEMVDELLPFIQTITNIVAVAIENKNLAKEQITQIGIKKEMEFAAEMQGMLFPSYLPKNKDVEINATYLPHREVGGDYYDYLRLINFEFLICMADVSGKGVPAALMMSNFQANLHALANQYSSLPKLVNQLNSRVNKTAKGEKFITMFLGKFNSQTRELNYVNAGHNPPLLIQNNEISFLEEGTTGLGMLDELPFVNEGKVYISPGSLLLCYTDGVVELENEEGELYGTEPLKKFLSENSEIGSMPDFHKKLLETFNKHRGSKDFVDDITLLSCRFTLL